MSDKSPSHLLQGHRGWALFPLSAGLFRFSRRSLWGLRRTFCLSVEDTATERQDGMGAGDHPFLLLLPRFPRLRSEFPAPALPAARGPRSVASVTAHADHLVQQAALSLGEAGHMEGEAAVV